MPFLPSRQRRRSIHDEPLAVTPEVARAYGLRFNEKAAQRSKVTIDEVEAAFFARYDNDRFPHWGPYAVNIMTSFKFIINFLLDKYERELSFINKTLN